MLAWSMHAYAYEALHKRVAVCYIVMV
jgi:hypothetical protein